MKNFKLFALSAAMLGCATTMPAWAQDEQRAQAAQEEDILVEGEAQAEEVDPRDQEVECRREEPPVGSRLRARRTCMTRAQWRRLEDDTRRFLRDGSDSIGGAPNYPVTRGGGGSRF